MVKQDEKIITPIELYKKHEKPPVWALKEIQAGRLKGKSDINPQWRIEALTDMFGLCGIGWKYVITKQWTEKANDDEISAFVNIELFIKYENTWSDAIPANGGSSFMTKERNGSYVSDECFKMALTDAISVASKMIGIASSVYNGDNYSKYQQAEMRKLEDAKKEEENRIAKEKEIKDAEVSLRACKTLDDLKQVFIALRKEVGEHLVAVKDEVKIQLTNQSAN